MPSEKILTQKQQAVSELSEKFKTAASGVVVNYSGITVADDTALRATLRKEGIEYTVIKNTLIGRACDIAGYSDLKKSLEGMTALAITTGDPVAPAKILKGYAEKIATFELKGGFVDGAVLDKTGVEELAAIPPKPILVGKLLGSLQKSLYGLCYVLQAKIDKENGGAEAPAAAPLEA